jgi:hypothetical protein
MYIQKTDYTGRITMSLLDILIVEDPDNIINAASKEAEDIIASMAGVLYDIAPELAKTANDRNGYILSLGKSIGLYFIYQRADDEEIPQKVIKNYDDAMDDLEKISTGKKVLALPAKPVIIGDSGTTPGEGDEGVSTEGQGLRRMGSQLRRSHRV